MATTLQSLKTYYGNIMRADFAHIPATHLTLLASLSSQIDLGTLSLTDARLQIARLSIETTSVASLAYNFFTGGPPSAAGLDYLISPTGPNPANLNSAYYQSFSVENRSMNFAVNLGNGGEGKAWFETNYGGLSLSSALAKAYAEIFGAAPDAAKIAAILNDQVPNGLGGTYARQNYFAAYGGDGLTGLGTKAAMVGWLMAEALKADIGSYAKANDAFIVDLGLDGVALFRSSLAIAYGTPAVGSPGGTLIAAADKSISLTATDTTLRSTNSNDTITGTTGLQGIQSIDAGAGRDTVNLTGTIYGSITTTDGDDTLTLGALGASTSAGGTPVRYGTVVLAGDRNTVTLTGGMAQGSSLKATGANNVLHVDAGTSAEFQGTISGFQTVYFHSLKSFELQTVADASVVYNMLKDPGQTFYYTIQNNETVVLKDTAASTYLLARAAPGGTRMDAHLQNAKGGDITFSTTGSTAPLDTNAILTVHVDTDSTAGLISGWGTNSTLGPNTKFSLSNLFIVGAGKLAAQVGSAFNLIDATQAGDLNLSFKLDPVTDRVLKLGDGTNVLNLSFASVLFLNFNLGAIKIQLGAGADTINLIKDGSVDVLANLHLYNGKLDPPSEIIGFQKGVDHLVADGLIHGVTANVQAYADGKTTLLDALTSVSAHVAASTAGIFAFGGDTYIYVQNTLPGVDSGQYPTQGDGLIKLTGVTGLTVGTGPGNYDIHFG